MRVGDFGQYVHCHVLHGCVVEADTFMAGRNTQRLSRRWLVLVYAFEPRNGKSSEATFPRVRTRKRKQ